VRAALSLCRRDAKREIAQLESRWVYDKKKVQSRVTDSSGAHRAQTPGAATRRRAQRPVFDASPQKWIALVRQLARAGKGMRQPSLSTPRGRYANRGRQDGPIPPNAPMRNQCAYFLLKGSNHA
jgi:hypothetical protein